MLRIPNLLALWAIFLLSSCIALGQNTPWQLKTISQRKVKLVTITHFTAPKLSISEWDIAFPLLTNLLSSQKTISVKMEVAEFNGNSTVITEENDGRQMLFSQVKVDETNPNLTHAVTVTITVEAILYERMLVPGTSKTPVDSLSAKEREIYTKSDELFDFKTPIFKKFMQTNKLLKDAAENELDFQYRVFTFLGDRYKYLHDEKQALNASSICKDKTADCGGINGLFVAIMRSNSIPSRTIGGRVAKSDATGEFGANRHYRAEIYHKSIGWIPVDLAPVISGDFTLNEYGISYHFGQCHANFVSVCVGSNYSINTPHWGKVNITWPYVVRQWNLGTGKADGFDQKETLTVSIEAPEKPPLSMK